MPVFEYKGLNSAGKEIKGLVDAENPQGARAKLKRNGVYITEITIGRDKESKSSTEISLKKKISSEDIAMMTRQLATLINAHIPIVESLSALIDQVDNVRLKNALSMVRDRVNEGSNLADALKEHPKMFSNLYINMVRAGEASGTLDVVLNRLADFTEGQMRLRGKLVSVLAYPFIMLLVSLAVMIFLFTYLIPKIKQIFDSINTPLPYITKFVIGAGEFFQTYWLLIIIFIFAVFFIFKSYVNRPKGRKRYDAFKLKLPIFGPLLRMVAVSRFASTFSTLLSSGVNVLVAMDIVKNVVNNVIFAQAIEEARLNISEGQTIAEPLRRSNEFPPLVTHMIAIGEKTGELEEMLQKISETYDNTFEARINTLTALMEPFMILAMAVIIGGIVVSIMLPLIQLTSAI